jgi:hypothetical protein
MLWLEELLAVIWGAGIQRAPTRNKNASSFQPFRIHKKPTRAALQPTGVGFFLHTRFFFTLKVVQNSCKETNLFFDRFFLFVPKFL